MAGTKTAASKAEKVSKKIDEKPVKKERKPRAPTAYNNFIKHFYAQFEVADGEEKPKPKEMIAMAATEWKKLTDDEKAEYKTEVISDTEEAIDKESKKAEKKKESKKAEETEEAEAPKKDKKKDKKIEEIEEAEETEETEAPKKDKKKDKKTKKAEETEEAEAPKKDKKKDKKKADESKSKKATKEGLVTTSESEKEDI